MLFGVRPRFAQEMANVRSVFRRCPTMCKLLALTASARCRQDLLWTA